MICKYFLPFCGLSFHFLINILWCMKVWNFDQAQFFFVSYTFNVIFKNPLCNPRSWRFTPLFSSVFYLILRWEEQSQLTGLKVLFSACSDLLLNISRKCFYSYYFNFHLQTLFFKTNLYLYWYLVKYHSLTFLVIYIWLPLVLQKYLKYLILNLCLVSLMSGLPQRQFLLNIFLRYTFFIYLMMFIGMNLFAFLVFWKFVELSECVV